VGFVALMEAGIDLGFMALMAAAVSGGQHRDRASRPQKELYCDIVGPL
jgi:diaminopimelate decarboxylase